MAAVGLVRPSHRMAAGGRGGQAGWDRGHRVHRGGDGLVRPSHRMAARGHRVHLGAVGQVRPSHRMAAGGRGGRRVGTEFTEYTGVVLG